MKKLVLLLVVLSLFLTSCAEVEKIEKNFSNEKRERVEVVDISNEENKITKETDLDKEIDVILEDKEVEIGNLIDEKIGSNLNELIMECKNLNDKDEYCNSKKKLVLENEKITYGTCRSFSKYRKDFSKKNGFCKSFGEEKKTTKGCVLENGNSDKNCDGN